MRLVGEVADAKLAEKFVTFLASKGIDAQVRDQEPGFGIWVLDEDELSPGTTHFQDFLKNPNSEQFNITKAPVPKKEKIDVSGRSWPSQTSQGQTPLNFPVTWTVIGICVMMSLLALSPGLAVFRGFFYFSTEMGRDFPEIREGQVWRLVTPIFLHGNALHLFFNMIWMYQLGGEIESEEGSRFLGLFLVFAAIVCDIAQYLVSGPAFVGLSGVVYAFLSYIWMMSRRSSKTQYAMNDQTLIFMLVWLLICIVGIIPSVANTQHVVGLLFGFAWGWIRSSLEKPRFKT
jgi:GlpG protein